MSIVAGPVGSVLDTAAGALLGGLFGGAVGCEVGSRIGGALDDSVLDNRDCLDLWVHLPGSRALPTATR